MRLVREFRCALLCLLTTPVGGVFFLLNLFCFIAFLVTEIPIGKDYYARRKSLGFACISALFDL